MAPRSTTAQQEDNALGITPNPSPSSIDFAHSPQRVLFDGDLSDPSPEATNSSDYYRCRESKRGREKTEKESGSWGGGREMESVRTCGMWGVLFRVWERVRGCRGSPSALL